MNKKLAKLLVGSGIVITQGIGFSTSLASNKLALDVNKKDISPTMINEIEEIKLDSKVLIAGFTVNSGCVILNGACS